MEKNNRDQQTSNRKDGECNHCHRLGHWAKDCYKRLREVEKKKKEQKEAEDHAAQAHIAVSKAFSSVSE